ncbi:MAG TPA: phospholipase D-like domain-containing protein [Chloroflexota bacterium]|nr:phospholipase D-like domain-containing protein [Chloroflexota bacterium]
MILRRLASAAAIALLLAACGSTAVPPPTQPVAANSEARIFVEPDDGPEPLLAELNAAQKSIDLTMYLLTARPVESALETAERRGVKVRVLLEQHPFGEGAGNADAYARLQKGGVDVRWSNPRFKLTHEKAAVVDGREALILTLNLTASAFTRNREYGAIVSTPEDVAEVQAIFDADWSRGSVAPSRPDLVVSPDNSRGKLEAIVGHAGRELDLESEEVQDADLEQALTAAASRGVNVRVVLSPAQSGPDANAKGIAQLKSSGVQVRLMRKPYVHAKIVLADGQTAFVGSENISRQSLDANRELGLFLNNADALSRMQSTFEQDWGSHS